MAATTEYVGNDPVNNAVPVNGPAPGARLDLRRVSIGADTFANPCFWILVGIAGTIGVQCLLSHLRNRK